MAKDDDCTCGLNIEDLLVEAVAKRRKRFDEKMLRECTLVKWLEPIKVSSPLGESSFCCRLCIAFLGLRPDEVEKHPQTRDAFDKHMKEVHGDASGTNGKRDPGCAPSSRSDGDGA